MSHSYYDTELWERLLTEQWDKTLIETNRNIKCPKVVVCVFGECHLVTDWYCFAVLCRFSSGKPLQDIGLLIPELRPTLAGSVAVFGRLRPPGVGGR